MNLPGTPEGTSRKGWLRTKPHLWISAGLVIATLAVYWQVGHHDFINFDDPDYVTENPNVQSGLTAKSIVWAFTTRHASNWHPLTWLSHMLDYQLWGMNAGPHLLTNVALHCATTLLLFFILSHITGAVWKSAFVAALFALHPLHVESVAWVAERKDVLSALFWMLTTWAYVRYVEQPGAARYALVLVIYAAGLLAKPMLVTLPFVFILMDYWPLQRLSPAREPRSGASSKKRGSTGRDGRRGLIPLLREKIPFFVLVVGSGIVTFIVQQKYGAVAPIESLSLTNRISNALVSYAGYLVKMVWPENLSVFYPYTNALPGGEVAGSVALLAGITWLAIRQRRKRPYLLVGWLWYVGTLVPVIGLVQVGTQSMADRYTYLTFIGIFIMLAWGVPDLLSSWRPRKSVLAAVSGLLVAGCMLLTFFQIRYWQDSFVLYEHALAVTSDNALAHNNLGTALFKAGKLQEAKANFLEALRINVNDAGTHNNLGAALGSEHKVDSAIVQYREAIRLKPAYADAQKNLGVALSEKGQLEEARTHLVEAVQLEPDAADVRENYASLLAKEGKQADAIAQYEEALRINPNTFEAHSSLAFLFANQGKFDTAIAYLSAAVRIRPEYADGHTNLGNLLAMRGKADSALSHFRVALRLNPALPLAHQGLASALSKQGKYDEAIGHFNEALKLNPNDAQSHYGLGVAFSKQGNDRDAIAQLAEALRLNPNFADARAELDRLRNQATKP